jgi:hypothetical protein
MKPQKTDPKKAPAEIIGATGGECDKENPLLET